MKRVVYTALTGGYDVLAQPAATDPRYDYVCFVEKVGEPSIGVWQLREIPYANADVRRLSRYPKMHPHELFPDYEYSVYVDANVVIRDQAFYDAVERCIDSGVLLAGLKHPFMDCAYEECLNVLIAQKESNVGAVCREYLFLSENGFPRKHGMYEANVILRRHHAPEVIAQCQLWWELFLRFAPRDQLSYSFTLYRCSLPFKYLLPPVADRNYAEIEVRQHPVNGHESKSGIRHFMRTCLFFTLNALPFGFVYFWFRNIVVRIYR